MQLSSKLLLRTKQGRGLFFFGAVFSLIVTAAQAQNIDEGKSATRLFADSCVNCHRNPRGLAKGRFRPTLFVFLKDHYTTSAGAAWELASYLASIDTPQSGRPRAAKPHSAAKKPRPSTPAPTAQSN
jgi:hypothetical protein